MVDDTVFGQWWLPDEEQVRVPGSLALSSRFPTLSLMGSLEPPSAGVAPLFSEPPTHPVVFGSEIAPDQKITIFNASGSVVHSDSQSNPGMRQDLNIKGTILFGCHLADSNLPVVSTMTARVFGLGHWLGARSVLGQRKTSATDPSRTLASLVSYSPKLDAIEIRTGTSLQFFFTYSENTVYGADGTVLSVTDDGAAQFSYESPVTLAEAEEDVALMVRLVTFFNGSTSWVQSQVVTLDRSSPRVEVWRGGRPDFEVPEASDLGQREVLHSTQIDLNSVVAKWYKVNQSAGRVGVNVLQAHHFKADQYVETGLLGAVTALEGLYRFLSTGREQELPIKQAASPEVVSIVANARAALPPKLHPALKGTSNTDTSLLSKLRNLLAWIGPQQFSAVVPVGKQDSWIKLAKDVRHSIIHDGDFTAHVDSSGLLALQLQVRWLLKLAILKHLDVTDNLLVEATLHSEEGRSASYTFRYLPTLRSEAE